MSLDIEIQLQNYYHSQDSVDIFITLKNSIVPNTTFLSMYSVHRQMICSVAIDTFLFLLEFYLNGVTQSVFIFIWLLFLSKI